MNHKFSHSILGGTFDHFHKGHKNFLDTAFGDSLKTTIGITSQEMLEGKNRFSSIETYETREESVRDYLDTKGYKGRYEILKLIDIYGRSLTQTDIDGMYVIPDTLSNGKLINLERNKRGLKEVEIVVVPTIDGTDGLTISSTRIRNGEIDRDGYAYKNLFEKLEELTLPNLLRSELKKPFGHVVENVKIINEDLKNSFLIAVGDIVVSNLTKQRLIPNISIFDYVSNRQSITDLNILKNLPKKHLTEVNEPGTIYTGAAAFLGELILKSLKTNQSFAIKISGEEDLLALPSILFAPLDAKVIYGLPNKGAVIVTVTEEVKRQVQDIVLKFEHDK